MTFVVIIIYEEEGNDNDVLVINLIVTDKVLLHLIILWNTAFSMW